ncbi:MAG: acetylxylan esterase [Paludibacteraceae bacterium]|nr:acetylxylan esterase [Paludibacteraceae bacterium]
MYILFISIVTTMVMAVSCQSTTPPEQNDPKNTDTTEQTLPADLQPLTLSVPVTEDWVYSSKPAITIHAENPNNVAVMAAAKMRIVTDMKEAVTTVTDSVEIPAKGKKDIVMTTTDPLEPGLYRATCSVNGKGARSSFIFAVDPFKIVSAPDKQSDYDTFWQTAKDQLAAINMNANLIELTGKSSSTRKVYLVELNSVPDGLTGEPVVIRGYYCEPQDGEKHPVIMHFFGYDTQNTKAKVDCPSGGSSQYAEFYLSHRGQYINNRPESSRVADGLGDLTNPYGDWFSYNFGNKDSYYYRGAYMDCVQAVRFMATRPTSNMTKLFAEGSSQGGALTYAAAALSDYPFSAIAANVAFLGDFAEALKIGGLAVETARNCKGSMTEQEMIAFFSYFDTKNLATRISCPVLASSGLQDNVCPPRTNIVPFNNLQTPQSKKEYIFGPEMGHDYPAGWSAKMWKLFRENM